MEQFVLNDKPAVKMLAKVKLDDEKYKSVLFDCEGDEVWLPRKCVKILDKDTILIEEWLYNSKF